VSACAVRRGRRILVAVVVLAGLLALLLGALVATAVATERGARWTLGLLERQGVEVGEVRGRLLGPLELRDLRYRAPGVEVRVGLVELTWRPRSLLGRALEVHRLGLEAVVVTLRDEEAAEPRDPDIPPELPELSFPVELTVHRAGVLGLTVHGFGDEPIQLEEIAAEGLAGEGSLFRIEEVVIRGGWPGLADEGFQIGFSGWVELAGDLPLEVGLEWNAVMDEGTELRGTASLDGSLADLALDHRLLEPVPMEFTARVAGLPGPPGWEARLHMARAGIRDFRPEGPLEWAALEAEARGSGTEARLEARFALGGEELGEVEGSLEAEIEDRDLRLDFLRVRGEREGVAVTADASGLLHLDGEPRGDLRLAWSARLPDGPPMAGRADLSGSVRRAVLEHHLVAPVAATLTATVEDLPSDPRWVALLTVPRTSLTTLDPELPDHRVGLSLEASGEGTGFRGRASGEGLLAEGAPDGSPMTVDLRFRGDWDSRRASLEDLAVRPPTGGVVRGRGEVDAGGAEPLFRFAGGWEGLEWQGGEDAPFRSDRGAFSGEGAPSAFQVRAEGHLQALETPPWTFSLAGGGTETAFSLDSLSVWSDAGRVAATGSVSWSGEPTWEGFAEVEGLLLSELGFAPGGVVDGGFTGSGEVTDSGPLARWSVDRLAWEEQDHRVEARGHGTLEGSEVQIEDFQVLSGANRLSLRGAAGDRLDLAWEIDAPELSERSGLEGRARGAGTLSGPASRPRIRTDLEAGGIRGPGFALDTVSVSAAVDLAGEEPVRLLVLLEGQGEGAPPMGLRLEGSGPLADHRLQALAWTEPGDSVALELAGGLSLPPVSGDSGGTGVAQAPPPAWDGVLADLSVVVREVGAWSLQAPAPLQLHPGAVTLADLCLIGEPGEACGSMAWEEGRGGEGWVRIGEVELERLAHLLPPDLALTGTAYLDARGSVDGDGAASGSLDSGVRGGRVVYTGPAGVEEVRTLEEVSLRAQLDPLGELGGRAVLRLQDGDGLEVEWSAGPVPGGPDTRVSGSLSLELDDRGFVAALSDELWNSRGTLRGAFRLDGTVGAPVLAGELRLDGAAVDIPELGIRVEDVHLLARDRGPDEWLIEGGARSGRGEVRVGGAALLPRPDRPGSLTMDLQGGDFQALDSSLGQVEVSPDLRLVATEERTDLTGEVRIPRAMLTPGELEGVVAASPDVVLAGEVEEEEAEATVPVDNLHLRVRVAFGDSVLVDGLGVSGRIAGAVTVIQEPGRLMTGQGEVRLEDGEYVAARQRLTIERGRLVYADRPLEDPGLDMRVTRRTPEVLAGMEIRGTARDPEITIFSEPEMPEAEAMAYLLIGRPIRGSGEGDGDLMDRRVTSMGLAGGAAVLNRLGPALGVAEARIDRGERLSDAALVVGTNFTPRLFVSYGVGIFGGTANVLRLRYQLAQNWILRTESARELGADLLYSVER
jgi:translocation and assembly module TamB